MNHNYYRLGLLLALWPLVQLASGQSLTIAQRSPSANTNTAVTNTNLTLTFNQTLSNDDLTTGGLRVFSTQRGGLLRNSQGGSASVSGSTFTFNPSTNFRPGETVFVTATTDIRSTTGARLSRGQVHQFTTRVGGTGRGYFTAPATNAEVNVKDRPKSIAVGDLDGDGDLDLLTANANTSVSVRFNDGSGNFTPPDNDPNNYVGSGAQGVMVGDIDGDGDLDMIVANSNSTDVSLRFNDGSGNFSRPATNAEVTVGDSPYSVALGDVDGDGDLDLLAANFYGASVSVRLNNGSGIFTAPTLNPDPGVGSRPYSVALGDVDGDRDLDMLVTHLYSDNVSVRLNNGSGNFTPPATNAEVGVGELPQSLAVGDVDGDGDLDFLTANAGSNTVSVRLNNGAGAFTAPVTNSEVGTGGGPTTIALGDVDGDGDLDFVTANSNGNNTVSVRLNNGSGSFIPPITNPNVGTGEGVYGLALGDVDGDGDLDFVTANYYNFNYGEYIVSVRLNGPFPAPTITGLTTSPSPACAGQPLTFQATLGNLSSSYTYTLTNGSTTISGTGTTSPFSQSLTASGSGVQTFTLKVTNSQGQIATATTNVTVSQCVTLSGLSADPNSICAGQPIAFQASVGKLGGSYSYTLTNGSSTTSGTATSSAFSQSLTASGSGVQTFSLTVATPDQRATATTSVTVSQCITLSGLSVSPNPVCAGQPVTFRASVGTLSGSYSYTLSNGSTTLSGTATGTAFTQPLPARDSGVQTFTLTVATPDQLATATTTVTVNQCLTSTGQAPSRNAIYAPVQSGVNLLFNQLLSNNAATLGGVRVFSAQRGGLLRHGQGGTASVAGLTGGSSNRLSFNPSTNFKPGETVFVTSTTAIQSTGGNTAPRQVYQFTTGVLGTGQGYFTPPATNREPGVGGTPYSVAVGDVDGDGDLDLLTANYNNASVSVRLNNGSGSFTPPATNPEPGVGSYPRSVALGDVDGDGDLDLVTANFGNSSVSVRLNNGSGSFTPPATNPEPGVGDGPISVALGDVDGDGDLDLVTANYSSASVSVRLNDGSGHFTTPATNPNPGVGDQPRSVALGDVDGDGDLDLLAANYSSASVSVRLNNGSGHFTPPATNPEPGVGSRPYSVAVGDVDGDGDLDLVTTNYFMNTVSVRLNDGSGHFTPPATNPEPGVDGAPVSVVFGDVDGDSDLDLVTANELGTSVSVRLNNGSGSFTPPAANPNPGVGYVPRSVALGDVDGDGDLDILAANFNNSTVSVQLNGPLPLTLSGLSASPNPVCAGQALSVTASVGNLTTSYSYTLSNGSTTLSGSATTPTFSRSLTASGSGGQSLTLTVSSQGQVATATTSLTVTAAPTASAFASSTTALVGDVISLSASGGTSYLWTAPPGATLTSPATTSTVSATLTSAGLQTFTVTVSQGSCSQTTTVTVTAIQLPDLTLVLYARPSTARGNQPISVVVDVFELNGLPTTAPLTLKISKDARVNLSLDTGLSSVGGQPVQNSQWQLSGPSGGFYTLTSNGVLNGTSLSVGLTGVLSAGSSTGVVTVSATVVGGEEASLDNNTDADKIEYFPQ
ncbi:beta strand repeat-containing protein [Spirosoma koreense]